MAHSHSHSSVRAPDNSNARRLLWAFIVTAGFMLIEAVGGAISGSLALLADAGHMLTDSAALLFALLAVRFASRPPNARHTFGWLVAFNHPAAFLNAIALVVITMLIVWEAIQRFQHPQPVAGVTMMVIAVAGLLANVLAFGSYIGVARSGILTYAPQRYTCLATCWARSARSWRPW